MSICEVLRLVNYAAAEKNWQKDATYCDESKTQVRLDAFLTMEMHLLCTGCKFAN